MIDRSLSPSWLLLNNKSSRISGVNSVSDCFDGRNVVSGRFNSRLEDIVSEPELLSTVPAELHNLLRMAISGDSDDDEEYNYAEYDNSASDYYKEEDIIINNSNPEAAMVESFLNFLKRHPQATVEELAENALELSLIAPERLSWECATESFLRFLQQHPGATVDEVAAHVLDLSPPPKNNQQHNDDNHLTATDAAADIENNNNGDYCDENLTFITTSLQNQPWVLDRTDYGEINNDDTFLLQREEDEEESLSVDRILDLATQKGYQFQSGTDLDSPMYY